MMCGAVPSLTQPAYSRSDPTLTLPRREKIRGGSALIELRRRPVRTGAKTLARFTTCRAASLSSVRDAFVSVRFSAARSSRILAIESLHKSALDPRGDPVRGHHLSLITLPHPVEGAEHAYTNHLASGHGHSSVGQHRLMAITTVIVPPRQFPSTPKGS